MDPRLAYLLERASQGLATAADYRELRAIIDADETGDAVAQANAFYQARQGGEGDRPFDPARWQPVLRAILSVDKVKESPPVRRLSRIWWAAASVVVLLSAGAYFLFHNK